LFQIFDGWNLVSQRFGQLACYAVGGDPDRLRYVAQRIFHDGSAAALAKEQTKRWSVGDGADEVIYRGEVEVEFACIMRSFA
jgi:hypothetical protein